MPKLLTIIFSMGLLLGLSGCTKTTIKNINESSNAENNLIQDNTKQKESIKNENNNGQKQEDNKEKNKKEIIQKQQLSIEQRIPKCTQDFSQLMGEDPLDCSQKHISINDARDCYEEHLKELCGICKVDDNVKFEKTIPKTDLYKCEPFFILNDNITDDIYYFMDIKESSISEQDLIINCNKDNIPIEYAQKCFYMKLEKLCKNENDNLFFEKKSNRFLTQKELQKCAPYFFKEAVEEIKEIKYEEGYEQGYDEGKNKGYDNGYDDAKSD